MKEFLSAHGVSFTNKNVAEDAVALEELRHLTGLPATPVIVVGEEVVVGFDRGRLQRLLRLNERGANS